MPRIYISAMETQISGRSTFDEQALKLIKTIKEIGIDTFWNKEWRDYSIIEREIGSCDALLAIVDETWQSSTWMASEITWANGDAGSGLGTKQRINPIPIFLYLILDKEKWGWLKSYEGPIILDRDIQNAIVAIKNKLLTPPHELSY